MTKKAVILFLICFSSVALYAQETEENAFTFDTETEYQKGLNAISAFQYDRAIDHFYECQRNEPDNLDYISKLAWCYLQTGNYSESKLYFQKVLKFDPKNITALSNLGSINEKELNYLGAEEYYRQLIKIDTTNSYYYRLNAFNAKKTKKQLEAITLFGKAHSLNQKDIVVINELANLYLTLNSIEHAETMAEKGLKLSENNIKLLYVSARIQNKKKKHENVIPLLEKAQSLRDTNVYYQTMLGVAYFQLDSLDKSIFQFENIISHKKETEHTHHYLSIAYDEKGDTEKSIFHLEKALEKAISPKASTYYEELASHYDKKKNYKKALEYYEEAYAHSKDPIYLFYIARNTDLFYKDKQMAIRGYQKYLKTKHKEHQDYAHQRITQLKEIIHQSK